MTALIFVHGINSSRAERAAMPDKLTELLDKYHVTPIVDVVAVATWRSLGDFMGDLVDLKTHRVRWDDAVEDVVDCVHETIEALDEDALFNKTKFDRRILFVGHSMGQPLLISALDRIVKGGKVPWEQARVLTLGGPMGNPMARPYFLHMDKNLWSRSPGGLIWHDYYNPEDPVCGGLAYRHFDSAFTHRLDFPGHPTPFNPFSEHSSYFDASEVYALMMALAESMKTEAAPAGSTGTSGPSA